MSWRYIGLLVCQKTNGMTTRKGFTLVEATMAIGLLCLLVVMSGVFFRDVLRISSTIGRSNASQQAPRVVLDEFRRAVAHTVGVKEELSRFAVSDGSIMLQQSSGEPINLVFHDSAVWYERGLVKRRLTAAGTIVDQLKITPVRSSDTAVDLGNGLLSPDLVTSVVVDLVLHDQAANPQTGTQKSYVIHFAVALPQVVRE